jgi:hypothetical protein
MANWEGKFWSHQRVPLVAWFQYVPYKCPIYSHEIPLNPVNWYGI